MYNGDNGRIMLKIVKSLSELNTAQFLAVYAESNRKTGQIHYPNLSEEQQINFAEEDLISYLREDFFRGKDAFCAIWIEEGVYKSALRIEPYRDGLLLHALETVPNARKMGYAYKLVIAVLEHLKFFKYQAVYSHVHKQNIPSLRLHKKCGFQQVSDSAVYIDGTVTQNSCTLMVKL